MAEVFLFRRMYHRLGFEQLVLAWGIVYTLSGIMLITWGPIGKSITFPTFLTGSFPVSGMYISKYFVFVISVALVIGFTLWIMFYHSRFGRELRAVAQDREIAGALGINHSLIFTATFVIGTFLAGVAGVLLAGSTVIAPGADVTMMAPAFIVIIVGGFMSFNGTILAALIIGLVEAFGFFYLSKL